VGVEAVRSRACGAAGGRWGGGGSGACGRPCFVGARAQARAGGGSDRGEGGQGRGGGAASGAGAQATGSAWAWRCWGGAVCGGGLTHPCHLVGVLAGGHADRPQLRRGGIVLDAGRGRHARACAGRPLGKRLVEGPGQAPGGRQHGGAAGRRCHARHPPWLSAGCCWLRCCRGWYCDCWGAWLAGSWPVEACVPPSRASTALLLGPRPAEDSLASPPLTKLLDRGPALLYSCGSGAGRQAWGGGRRAGEPQRGGAPQPTFPPKRCTHDPPALVPRGCHAPCCPPAWAC
jgi:hypothetical protein